MPDKKMNLLDLQREYGIADSEVQQVNTMSILTFWKSDSGTAMSKLTNGGVVFQNREGGPIINPGETWVVELIEKGTTYFARGVKKLDAQFLFDLRNDQIDEMAEVIWEKHRSLIEPRFEEKVRNRYDQDIKEAVAEANAESKKREDESNAKAEDLKKELDSQSMKHKLVVSSLEEELAKTKNHPDRKEKSDASSPADAFQGGLFSPVPRPPRITRIGPDTLSCEDFVHHNYFVHISSDQSIMTIRPHQEGNVVCIDGKIQLNGLSLISSYSGRSEMPAEYSPKYGGFVVLLKYSPSSSVEPSVNL